MTWMLDTNMVSHIIKGHTRALAQLEKAAIAEVCISVVTEAELHFGLAKRPEATRLHLIVREFLRRAEVVPWDSTAARIYGKLRADLESAGKVIGALDLMIAAHAVALDYTLVTNDAAFGKIAHLKIEDWTR
jgi:tRNA(fMet)-specific endonuclease VapC